MDKIYTSYIQQASPKIGVKDYFKEYSELLNSTVNYEKDKSTQEQIFQLMNVNLSPARQQLIMRYCSIDNLRVSVETTNNEESRQRKQKKEKVKIPEKIIENTQLKMIKVLMTYDPLYKFTPYNGIEIKYEKSKLHDNTAIPSLTPGQDFLVYVRMYEPFKYSTQRADRDRNLPVLRLKSVISILGQQYLSELRDKITCPSDLSISTDISENPRQKIRKMAKDVYKSGFFFIEDMFYNDTRDPKNIDYSDVILKWADSHDIGPFKTANMEDVQIQSLCARFGFPWVYQHQGCCEHLIVLTDARLMNENDDLVASVYPRIERLKPTNAKNCIMCGILNVRWITLEHDRVPHDISYFCEKCFKSYNYVDGNKIGNFKAYRYPCIPELMITKRDSNTS